MLYVVLPPDWLREENPDARPKQGYFTFDRLLELNAQGYNCYYYPNYPSEKVTKFVDGSEIDVFEYVFVDMDLKDGFWPSKEAFLEKLLSIAPEPTKIIDSGGGIHAYWKISDLDSMSFLRLQRRLCRTYNTDEAVSKIKQLMRVPGTANTKDPENSKLCETLCETELVYTCEDLDKALPGITQEDEAYCQAHYNKTYSLDKEKLSIDDKLPMKFGQLLRKSQEAKDIWSGLVDDRSKADYRLGHLMFADGFTKAEAMSVLVNSAKALSRAPTHRVGYAEGIVEKIWTYEVPVEERNDEAITLESSVKSILEKSDGALEGERIPCWRYIDATHVGFRRGHVMGLVAGSGVGKTAMALNIFMGFASENPDLEHFFFPLEQTNKEIAARWKTMCGESDRLHSKVHVISNYEENGVFRDLSLESIKNHILWYKKTTGKKVGCVVIDHIGVLCNNNKLGQDEGVKQISKAMKSFAIETDTFLIMQSQTSREKAGIGDLELNKDAAFGTSVFENFCDFLVTLWQPLKRSYGNKACPAVTAFKFCKIRHKKKNLDAIQEDVRYRLLFDPETERMRELTQDEEKAFDFFNKDATNKRKLDRKTDIMPYKSMPWAEVKDESRDEGIA